ncbi:MAG: transcription-repair coupling factor, partial [Thermodesulfobacteriota bacterium]
MIEALGQGEGTVEVTGLRGGARALLAARILAARRRPLLCIVPSEREAQLLEQDLALFTLAPVVLFPAYDIPPYTPLSPDAATVAARLGALHRILSCPDPLVVVAPVAALLRRLMPRALFSRHTDIVIREEEVDLAALVGRLALAGYDGVALTTSAGDFSVRGGVLDVFPPGSDLPVRLDFFGDFVESLRLFDPISQRSVRELEAIELPPARDILLPPHGSAQVAALVTRFQAASRDRGWDPTASRRLAEQIRTGRSFPGMEAFAPLVHGQTSTLADYLPADAAVLLLDPLELGRSVGLVWERIRANFAEAKAGAVPALPPEELFLGEAGWRASLGQRPAVTVHDFATPEGRTLDLATGGHILLKQGLDLERKGRGLLAPLARQLAIWLTEHQGTAIACRSLRHAEQLVELLRPYGLPVAMGEAPWQPAPAGERPQVRLFGTPLSEGFTLSREGQHILSASELLGERRLGPSARRARKAPPPAVVVEELALGDAVVHRDHGIGLYQGLVHMQVGALANDFLVIAYQGEDKLYVPVDRFHLVHKYQGLDGSLPRVDKLGGTSWAGRKKKVREAVSKVAGDLLELYAQRALRQGHAFSRPDDLYREFEEAFPYEETAGQSKAIDDILADLTAERPTDRLLCGDVGYGKTEVAMRAAFKVVVDGFQVALLVPTTVLAEQHAETFQERFAGFPVEIRSLSRFRTAAEERQIARDLAAGRVDVVIGTHRLLQKDILFKRLGLVIIDEEHRFGVAHKERLKKLRTEVDILTLTATPIPRTLQMSLLGIRDLSVISTAPEHRRAVKTFVARYDDLVIKEALTRELQRRGQVFFVHNRVQTIHEMAARVQALVPQARIAVAHGQMAPRDLEEIMVRFVQRQLDVLVCTTIIESGLDIPSANTIVINRADRLGLAEIYQLRGRVGRSREQAYAYLLVPSLDGLSRDAQKRLKAVMEYDQLGGGFKLAMSDLQIRGGGNLLGVSQSGHIAAVGYELYLDLLGRTVADLKRKAA